ncbi:hypothetical protein SAMN05216358_3747 [Rhizobium sp. AN5]|uniref:hypothetical protein n=1 Tax=Rhizobium sp. AN5 TaxID=1855304 RepID=UPI000BCE8250|nr:hypothetical protein [Rhizobium sp. AN5]SOC93567.1 hypothetical protein SAMN05216358_3747 [Rhizobium sp. AN5]
MNNAATILMVGMSYAMLFNPWWGGLPIGLVVGFLSCLLVDGIWWLMRRLAT